MFAIDCVSVNIIYFLKMNKISTVGNEAQSRASWLILSFTVGFDIVIGSATMLCYYNIPSTVLYAISVFNSNQ